MKREENCSGCRLTQPRNREPSFFCCWNPRTLSSLSLYSIITPIHADGINRLVQRTTWWWWSAWCVDASLHLQFSVTRYSPEELNRDNEEETRVNQRIGRGKTCSPLRDDVTPRKIMKPDPDRGGRERDAGCLVLMMKKSWSNDSIIQSSWYLCLIVTLFIPDHFLYSDWRWLSSSTLLASRYILHTE